VLTAALGLTAFLVGLAGSWSPCSLSMVGTIGAGRRIGGRRLLVLTETAFAAGLVVGALALYGLAGLAGSTVHSHTVLVVVLVLAALAAAADAAGLRVRPQLRFQVPEGWRRTMPLPRAVFLYGVLLGTGLTTYLLAEAAWVLLPLSFAIGSVPVSLAIALGFAAGRALPILVLVHRGGETVLAERPQGLRVLRLLVAATLVAALLAGEARAATRIANPGGDPSGVGTDLAWQQPGVGGFLLRAGQPAARLPGNDPAVGDTLVAWHVGPAVTVASRDTLTPVIQETVPGVQKLAVSSRWLVWRAAQPDGSVQIRAQPIADPTRSSLVVSAKHPGILGRPSLWGDTVVFHYATGGATWLTAVDVQTGARRRVRFSDDEQLLNPSLLGNRLLYVRASRCAQELVIGPLGAGRERVLYKLAPLAGQDAGHEEHHTQQGEHLPCPHRPKPTSQMLWTTALTGTTAYVTVLRPRPGGRTVPRLLAIARPAR